MARRTTETSGSPRKSGAQLARMVGVRQVARQGVGPSGSTAISGRGKAGSAKAAGPWVSTSTPRIPDGWESGTVRILGIDPGQHVGLAYFEDGELLNLRECRPEEIPDLLKECASSVALVVFEDSRLTNKIWTAKGNEAQRDKMVRNVGEIDAWCKLIVGRCAMHGIPCLGRAPCAKAGNKGRKLDSDEFAAQTGWTKRSNEHQRDAAMIAWDLRGMRP